ncbi:MAG: RNA pseudouridine synthase [Merismopedia sp. SIO2A8]|nr:RNA pseudouridine synthase [Symploca sp. SIO2B6]NET48340.1 RNA pseudouridine synthase [Merismopedia sp. SIO2A8]
MRKSLQSLRLNQGWTYTEQILPSASGQTVLDYYTQRYRHSNRSTWKARIEAKQIRLDNHPTSPSERLQSGQILSYHRPPWYEPDIPLKFEVLYEDEALWAIAKPSGLPVLPGGKFLTHTLLHQLQIQYPHENPVPVHRLGRGTSGVMLVARSPQARSHLSHQLRTHTMTKVYRALIGIEDLSLRDRDINATAIPDRFTLHHPIGKMPHPALGYIYNATPSGKSAHSECHVLERDLPSPGARPLDTPSPTFPEAKYPDINQPVTGQKQQATLLDVKILTGRPHQIRIHLAAYGYPLLGDPLYRVGEVVPEAIPSDCGYWLHAHRIGFIHPITEMWMMIECPPPMPLRLGSESPLV